MEARRDLAQQVALKLLVPVMVIVPVIALLLTLALRKGLRPLARASNDVERTWSAKAPLRWSQS